MQKQIITIKGTKEGLNFYIEDASSFLEVINELESKLSTVPVNEHDEKVLVIINLGYRFLQKEQKTLLKELIENDNRFIIERFDSEVISRQEAEEWIEQSEVKAVSRIIRSGQVFEVVGDLLLIGDVNPGGEVRATGNIFIMGKLQGIAHAGVEGDESAVIAASYMNPSQLRIADLISRPSDGELEGLYMEFGYIEETSSQISISKLNKLPYVRKDLRELERRMLNG